METRYFFLLLALLLSSLRPSFGAISDVQTAYPIPSGYIPRAVASGIDVIDDRGTTVTVDVMVGPHGSIAVRRDAGAWNFIFSGNADDTFTDLTFAQGLFIAIGNTTTESGASSGVALTSPDGKSWRRNPIPEARKITAVAFGKSTFVVSGELADGETATFTSADTKTWTTHDISGRIKNPLTVVRFLAGRFIGAANLQNIYASEDGVNWGPETSNPLANSANVDLAGNGKLIVAIGSRGVRISKNSGSTWSAINPDCRGTDVVYFAPKDLFVAVDSTDGQGIAVSKNGEDWTLVTLNTFSEASGVLTSVCRSGNGLLAVGAGADGITTAMTSNDGQSWISFHFGRFTWEGSLFSDGAYYAVGVAADPLPPIRQSKYTYRSAILKSTDGYNWDPILKSARYFRAIAKGNRPIVAVGGTAEEGAEILYSYDGSEWRSPFRDGFGLRDSSVLNDVAFGHGKFVAVGTTVLDSKPVSLIVLADQLDRWDYANSGVSGLELTAVVYGAPQGIPTFVAVGKRGGFRPGSIILRSLDDGTNWKDVTPDFPADSDAGSLGLKDVTVVDGVFIAVGDKTFWFSSDGKTWNNSPFPQKYQHLFRVEAGPNELYLASDIVDSKMGNTSSVLNARSLINYQRHELTASANFEQIHSMTAQASTLIIGTDNGISRASSRPTVKILPGKEYPENASGVYFFLNRNETADKALTVHYSITGSAKQNIDFAPLSGTALFDAGTDDARILVFLTNNPVVELDKDIICTISENPNYLVGTPAKSTMTILNDDLLTCNFSITSAQVTEGDNLVIVLKRNTKIGRTTLNVTVADTSTATSLIDYNLDTSVVFDPGEDTRRLTLQALTDSRVEGTESLALELSLPPGEDGRIGNKSTMTISLADATSTVTVTASKDSTTEGSIVPGAFRIARTGGTEALSINIAMSGTATNGTDYTSVLGPIQLPKDINSVDVSCLARQDLVQEGNETAIMTIQAGTGYKVGAPAAATVTLFNAAPVGGDSAITITSTPSSTTEGSVVPGAYHIVRSGGTAALSINITMSGTATNGTDYTSIAGPILLAQNTNSVDVSCVATQDSLVEGSETAIMTIQAGTGYSVGSPAAASVTVLNGAPPGSNSTVTVTTTQGTTAEGSFEVGTFHIERTGGTQALSINITMSGTATNGTDYTAIASQVQLPVNVNSLDVSCTPTQDSDVEGNETVILNIQTGTGYNVGAPSDATVALLDDDD